MSSRSMQILLMFVMVAALACGRAEHGEAVDRPAGGTLADDPVVVYTANYPLAYFAERIGGQSVQVEFPAPADIDPAYWRPTAEIIAAYQDADVVLRNGAGYAGWMDTATLPASRVVDTSGSLGQGLIVVEDAVTHSHGPGGEHDHGAKAFTTWLDPVLAAEQASAVERALVAARPERAEEFASRLDGLRADLDALDRRLEAAFSGIGDEPWLASHPVYQYLGRRYGLDLISVHFEPDAKVDDAGWRELRQAVGDRDVRHMLWEAEPLAETRERLESSGIRIVVFETCGNRPADGDYLSVMAENAARVESVVSR